ncbi:MAG: dihydroneopterin aldolase [Firmicutes bacterium]|nr:dihydroneopterin aldolase [Bacillota bacterium]
MDTIFMRNMVFYGYHGVFPEERKLGQKFVVSVWMTCDVTTAAVRDDIHLTVDYADVYNTVRQVLDGPPRRLLESAAIAVANQILSQFTMLESVRVRIDKPGAPIPGIVESVGVDLTRTRAQLARGESTV